MAITTLKSTRDFARIWFFWKIPAILIFSLIVICISLYSITRIPLYESTAKILLLPKTNDDLVISAGTGQRQYDIQRVNGEDINTEVELIKSREVIDRTIAYFEQMQSESTVNSSVEKPGISDVLNLNKKSDKVYGKKAISLFSSMNVEPIYSSNMISISIESHNQGQVADVLNKIVEIYMRYHKEMYSLGESEGFYDKQKEHYGEKLKLARDRLNEYNMNNKIANLDGQIQANISLISRFNGNLQDLVISIADNEARLKILNFGLNNSGGEITLSKEMRRLPVIVELAKGLVPLLIKRTEISKTFTKESREFQQINDQIKMLRQEIRNESISALKTDSMETVSLKTKKDALIERIAHLNGQIEALLEKKQTLNVLELDMQMAKENYLIYGSKTENSRLYAERKLTDLSDVVVAEHANTPFKRKSPNVWLAFQVSIFLGLFAGLILPFILESIDNKIKTADDVESIFSIPVVCSYNKL